MEEVDIEWRVPPITIEFMLACYCSGNPKAVIGEVGWDSDAGGETIEWLRANGLINPDNTRATEKGEAWVKKICATPIPKQIWV